jgi:hypothetical protein
VGPESQIMNKVNELREIEIAFDLGIDLTPESAGRGRRGGTWLMREESLGMAGRNFNKGSSSCS